MTEKKKRGRPPGSGKGSKNRPKIEPFDPSKLDQEVKEVLQMPDGVFELQAHGNRPEGLAIDADKYNINFPSNWNEMGKIAKLQWLTEHKR